MEVVAKRMTQTLTTKVEPIKFNLSASKPHISWRDRAYELSYWTEAGLEKENLLQEVIDFFLLCKYFIVVDRGWSGWDLEIHRGLWSRVEVKVCTENHGGSKRLLRVRCAPRMSQFATMIIMGYFLLIVAGIILGMPQLAAVTVVVSALNAVVILYQHLRLGQILYNVLKISAKKLHLLPIHVKSNSHANRSDERRTCQ